MPSEGTAELGNRPVLLCIPPPTSLQLQYCSSSRVYPTFPMIFSSATERGIAIPLFVVDIGFCNALLINFFDVMECI